MNTDLSLQEREIKYRRFLNGTLQVKELREDIGDIFTRKVFDYLEGEPLFDPQVFCAFLYHFIFICKLKRHLVMTAETNVYDKIRLNEGAVANELLLHLTLHSYRFALPSIDPNQFYGVALEGKLKHLLSSNDLSLKSKHEDESVIAALRKKNNPSWKTARVKIILPEMRGNTGIVPFVDLEFTLPRLSTEQKLDVIHFAICALNYLSQKDGPIESFSNPENPSLVLVSKSEHLKVISDNLAKAREFVISNAIDQKEGYGDDLEFNVHLPDIARILTVQSQDLEVEKQWLKGTPPVFVEPKAETAIENETQNKEENKTKTKKLPINLEDIINAAVRLSENLDYWKLPRLAEELNISERTLKRRMSDFGLGKYDILNEAQQRIREREK